VQVFTSADWRLLFENSYVIFGASVIAVLRAIKKLFHKLQSVYDTYER